jgi:hypothetical protein
MSLTNWVGQEINVGDLVSYASRSGSNMIVKVGEILEATPGEHPKVLWRYEPTSHWERNHKGLSGWRELKTYNGRKSIGRPNIDTLFLLHPDTKFEETP